MNFPNAHFGSLYEMGVLVDAVRGIFPSTLIGIAMYVLTALALYTMAQRRGIHKPWLAWIPVVNVWILGSLSDQYRYVARGENRSKRKSLVILAVIAAVIGVVVGTMAGVLIFRVVYGIITGVSEAWMMDAVTGPLMGILGMLVPMLGVAIARAVVYYMALYDVYKSMDPANSVVFLVLSILFGFTEPFFLFFNRNKDLGMPPRREPVYTTEEPWDHQ